MKSQIPKFIGYAIYKNAPWDRKENKFAYCLYTRIFTDSRINFYRTCSERQVSIKEKSVLTIHLYRHKYEFKWYIVLYLCTSSANVFKHCWWFSCTFKIAKIKFKIVLPNFLKIANNICKFFTYRTFFASQSR